MVAQARPLAAHGSLLYALAEVPVFQLWTAESVAALGAALRALPGPVVEVGAGDGRLSAALRAAGVAITATDLSGLEAVHPVRPLSAALAPDVLGARVVVSSWMPYGEDWTPAWRATDSVTAYLLIGERPPGCVGTEDAWAVARGWTATAVAGFTAGAVGRTDRWRADGTLASTTTAVLYRRDATC